MGSNWEVLSPQQFKLETRVGTPNKEKIEINFERTLQESGWMLSLESKSKVSISHAVGVDKGVHNSADLYQRHRILE